jgi:hypothetical protein
MAGGRAQSVRDELHQQGGGGEGGHGWRGSWQGWLGGGHGCPSPDLASFGGRETVARRRSVRKVAQGVN